MSRLVVIFIGPATLTLLFLVLELSTGSAVGDVSKVICSSCLAANLTGCDVGYCTGDYCVDYWSFDPAEGDASLFGRGCYSVFAGRNHFESVKKNSPVGCISRRLGNAIESLCGCNDRDYCNNGSMSVDHHRSTAAVTCSCGASEDATCLGDACIVAVDGAPKGSLNYKSEVFASFQPYPRLGSGCASDGEKKGCLCDSDYCNGGQTKPSYRANDVSVTCHDSASATCKGNGCGVEINVTASNTTTIRQFCHYEEGSNQFDRYCDSIDIAGKQRIRCYCAEDMCNENILTATISISKRNQCYLCEDQAEGCDSSDFCEGDVCFDQFEQTGSQGKLSRGCYEYLAGGPERRPGDDDCSLIETQGRSRSFCACSNSNYCMHGAAAIGKAATEVQCFTDASHRHIEVGSCKGEACLSGNITGCLTSPKEYGQLDPLVPPKGGLECSIMGHSKICSCNTTVCNHQMKDSKPQSQTPASLLSIACLKGSTETCFGAGCYYHEVDGTIARGCIEQTRSSGSKFAPKTVFACARKVTSTSVTVECVCPQDCCNFDLEQAIKAVNEGPSNRTEPPSSCIPTTTTTTTTKTTTPTPTTVTATLASTSEAPSTTEEASTSTELTGTATTTSPLTETTASGTTPLTTTQTIHSSTLITTTKSTTTIQPYGKRKCYYCTSKNSTGCASSSCVGFYCVDRLHDGHMTRGCYDHLAGYRPDDFAGDECTGNNIFGAFSLCGCKDSDFCRSGPFKIYDPSPGIQCHDDSGSYCRGSKCVYGSRKGCLTTSPHFQYYSYMLPLGIVDGCLTVDGDQTLCTCADRPLCNDRTVDAMDVRSQSTGTVECKSSHTSTGSCMGQACYLSIVGTDAWKAHTGCISGVAGGVPTSSLFCTSLRTPGKAKTTVCLCNSDFCNDSVDNAINSVNYATRTTTTAPTTVSTTTVPTTTTDDNWTPKAGVRDFPNVFLTVSLLCLSMFY